MCLTLHSALSVKRSAKRSGSGSARSMISSSVMISLSWDCAPRPGYLLQAIRSGYFHHVERLLRLDILAGATYKSRCRSSPGRVGRAIGSTAHILDIGDDFLVAPSQREILSCLACRSVPVPATAVPLTVEYVRGPLGADADIFRGRPVRGLHLIPAAPIRSRVGPAMRPARCSVRCLAVGGSPHLVVLRTSQRFRPLEPLLTPTRAVLPEHRRRFPQVRTSRTDP